MPESRKAAFITTVVAIAFVVGTQFVIWRDERRLNPGLIAALGLMIGTLFSLRGAGRRHE